MKNAAIIGVLSPGAAFACALPPSIVMTLPTDYYMAGAALTVLVTGALGAATHTLPDLQAQEVLRRKWMLPETILSYFSWMVMAALILIGYFGSSDPMHNALTLVFWTGVWVALPMASMLLGNLWQPINPWTAPVRIARVLLGRTGGVGLSRLGHWPAVAGLLGFSWFTIVSMSPENPATLAQAMLIYWLLIFAAAVLEGEEWLTEGEFLTVYMGFIARIAPLWAERGPHDTRIMRGWPGAQILRAPHLSPSAVGFVTLALASLTFDGLSATFWWLGLIGENPLEFTGRSAVIGVNTVGLIGTWGMTAAAILTALRLGEALAPQGQIAGDVTLGRARRGQGLPLSPILLSFLAIAAGYHAAHYLVTLLTAGQYAVFALNDPLFRGDDLLGLGPFFVSMGFLADRTAMILIWNTQFALILGAHVLAVVLALRLAGEDMPARAHLPMTILMVGYTVLGLWLLASPTAF